MQVAAAQRASQHADQAFAVSRFGQGQVTQHDLSGSPFKNRGK